MPLHLITDQSCVKFQRGPPADAKEKRYHVEQYYRTTNSCERCRRVRFRNGGTLVHFNPWLHQSNRLHIRNMYQYNQYYSPSTARYEDTDEHTAHVDGCFGYPHYVTVCALCYSFLLCQHSNRHVCRKIIVPLGHVYALSYKFCGYDAHYFYLALCFVIRVQICATEFHDERSNCETKKDTTGESDHFNCVRIIGHIADTELYDK
ncbi:hypothetical protein CHS0354_030378 [Potamilus streckersoni]|uniref:Uncharacterized protein n=1 Tax=Potamilus streckersoni TaxID=2493646 RepID=A0AAE0T4C6_9BIVA|nr:hypothetical protein CHS0354_030378 [Potamilus streckersoni]